jgi:hypothetical protein
MSAPEYPSWAERRQGVNHAIKQHASVLVTITLSFRQCVSTHQCAFTPQSAGESGRARPWISTGGIAHQFDIMENFHAHHAAVPAGKRLRRPPERELVPVVKKMRHLSAGNRRECLR